MIITISFREILGIIILAALLCYGLYLMIKGK